MLEQYCDDEYHEKDDSLGESYDLVGKNVILQSLYPDYYALYKVDFADDRIMLCYSSDGCFHQLEEMEDGFGYNEWVWMFSQKFVVEEDRERFCSELRKEQCLERLVVSGGLAVNFRWKIGDDQFDYVQLRMNRVENDQTPFPFCLGIFDIAEETKQEFMQREYLEETLREKSEQMGAHAEFIYKMSHEIRLLLNDIVTAQMVVRLHFHEKDRVFYCLDLVDKQCNNVRNILHKVWYISQLEARKIVWKEEAVDLREVIEDILERAKGNIGRQKRNIEIEMEHVTHGTVLCDYRRIYHLFEYLLDNSVKFTEDDGEITITVKEEPRMEKTSSYEFTISDNGMGIEPKFMEKLYMPFHRSERVREAKIEGAGLGLTIVHNILEILKGEITVESELDKGTTVTVTLELPICGQSEREDEP